MSREMQLIVLDTDTINHPSQLSKSPLAPIVVYIRISSPKVIQRLIKSRGKSQVKAMSVQMTAAEKLNTCSKLSPVRINNKLTTHSLQHLFDLIIDDNQLEDACDTLIDYMESYYHQTHPTLPVIIHPHHHPHLAHPHLHLRRPPRIKTSLSHDSDTEFEHPEMILSTTITPHVYHPVTMQHHQQQQQHAVQTPLSAFTAYQTTTGYVGDYHVPPTPHSPPPAAPPRVLRVTSVDKQQQQPVVKDKKTDVWDDYDENDDGYTQLEDVSEKRAADGVLMKKVQ